MIEPFDARWKSISTNGNHPMRTVCLVTLADSAELSDSPPCRTTSPKSFQHIRLWDPARYGTTLALRSRQSISGLRGASPGLEPRLSTKANGQPPKGGAPQPKYTVEGRAARFRRGNTVKEEENAQSARFW